MTDQEMFDNLTEGIKNLILEFEKNDLVTGGNTGSLLRSVALTAYIKGRSDESSDNIKRIKESMEKIPVLGNEADRGEEMEKAGVIFSDEKLEGIVL